MKTKVVLITNIISPYRIPLYNYIYKKRDFDFKVIALAEKEENREWEFQKSNIKFNYQVLPGWHLFFRKRMREIPIHINRRVFKMLFKYKPEAVITSGYDSLAYWQAFFYCKLFKKKYILWNGTTLLSAGGVRGIRRLFKKIIIKGADKYIVYGTKAKEYLEYFGAKPKDIYLSLNTVDVDYFEREVFRYRNSKDFLAEGEKYPKVLLLYVGQLIKRKGIKQVLRALSSLDDPEIGFMIVGGGPEEKDLKEFSKKNGLKNVFFEGFQQQEELPKYYALADIFVLPSFQEVWGLVINEALASGLYVLCSKYAGAGHDLVWEKENGELFDPENVEDLVEKIKKVKNQIKAIRLKREKISKDACNRFSIKRSGQSFLEAIEAVQRN